ncbi:MAG: NfeD family protein [Alphaproteobacteria bacterium]|jgi:hypothetical protein|nr:NfeD family protein [Alphaproteobacteria bacterium]
MDEFVAWLWDASYWHWWAFAVALIGIEAFAPSTFLIWPAVSAVVVGIALAVEPGLDWRYQILAFAVLAVISNTGWFFWLRRHPTESDKPALNLRGASYIGRRVTVEEAFADGRGRLRLDDSWWIAQSEDSATIEAGVVVEIIGADGTTLTVRAHPPPD